MEQEFRRQLDVKIIPNMYDAPRSHQPGSPGRTSREFPENCTNAVVNRSADLNEATKRRTTVWDVNSKGVGAQDINSLTEELLLN